MEDHVQAIRDAVAAIARITDRNARARAATEALELLTTANGDLARLRRDDIRAMRAEGDSYRKIAAALGIHFTRVRHIESGVPTGNSSRARAAKAQAQEKAVGDEHDGAAPGPRAKGGS
jgi:DNA invertase Pin-like site-specific DNA recombinase